ncbi:hypothetical protein PDIP_86940 [Penicillium digitatum Pd1]|uniref:Uncharacterized protein n=1 Tax=Penicillium digitatum (strain Pd1 / CECT 20795) TaxID=1170230 RepID=K9F644_PEND1|nr:hypothetical protein PDIP_86940 [Penicillium digitatum Pd1]EKV04524.1 hypothetical protein PDIP_86940 [Penicillium digitatum Pd1]
MAKRNRSASPSNTPRTQRAKRRLARASPPTAPPPTAPPPTAPPPTAPRSLHPAHSTPRTVNTLHRHCRLTDQLGERRPS